MELLDKIANWVYKILGPVFLILALVWIVHPLLTYYLIPPLSVHRRVCQYTSGQYKKYEDGKVFADFTESSELVEKGEIIAFYHVNHWLRDNPIHGKHFDFFALDVQLTQEEYDKAKAAQLESFGKPYKERDFEVWTWSIGEEENAYFLGFCDSSNSVKYVLITETTAREIGWTAFYYHSEIDWLIPSR